LLESGRSDRLLVTIGGIGLTPIASPPDEFKVGSSAFRSPDAASITNAQGTSKTSKGEIKWPRRGSSGPGPERCI